MRLRYSGSLQSGGGSAAQPPSSSCGSAASSASRSTPSLPRRVSATRPGSSTSPTAASTCGSPRSRATPLRSTISFSCGTSGASRSTQSSTGRPSIATSRLANSSPCAGCTPVTHQPSGHAPKTTGSRSSSTGDQSSSRVWLSPTSATTRISPTKACAGSSSGSRSRSAATSASNAGGGVTECTSGWRRSSAATSQSSSCCRCPPSSGLGRGHGRQAAGAGGDGEEQGGPAHGRASLAVRRERPG